MLMMTASLRTQIIAGTAALACLLVIGMAFFLLREIGPGPASLLPAERTLMLVTNMPPTTQQALQDLLPDLKGAPLHEQGTPVAALVRTGNKTAWVTFDAHGTPSVPGALLQEGETPLSADNAYSRLSATYTPTAPWLFARFPETKLQVEGIAVPSSPMTISMGTGSVRIAWPTRMTASFTGPVMKESSPLIFRLNAANLGSFLTQAVSVLSDSVRLPANALLRSWVSSVVGNDMSVRYDVVPALEGAGTMVINNASGSLEVGLRALPSESAEKILTTMEQGALGSAVGAEHVERTFDEKFTFETMKAGADVTPTKEEQGGWTIHTISPEAFVTATHGREVAIATSKALLLSLLEATMGNATQHVADGMMQEHQISELLHTWHIPLNLPWKLVPGTGESILWALDRQGSLAILTVGR